MPTPAANTDFVLLCSLLQRRHGNGMAMDGGPDDKQMWRGLAELAAYHGVAPVLYARLSTAEWPGTSEAVRGPLQRMVGLKGAHSLFLVTQLRGLVTLLRRSDIPHLVIKGPALAATAYPGFGVRTFADLDVLIERADFGRLEKTFLAEGLTQRPLSPRRKQLYLAIHGQYSFARAVPLGESHGHLTVDVHTAAFPPGYSYRYRFDELMARSRTFQIGGDSFQGLSPEDALTQLAFHGIKNRWNRLKFVVDVAEVIRSGPRLDWDVIQQRARTGRWLRVMQLSWLLAADLLAAPVPDGLLEEARNDRRVVQAAEHATELLSMPHGPEDGGFVERVRFNMGVQDHLGGRVRYATYAAVRRLSDLVLTESA